MPTVYPPPPASLAAGIEPSPFAGSRAQPSQGRAAS